MTLSDLEDVTFLQYVSIQQHFNKLSIMLSLCDSRIFFCLQHGNRNIILLISAFVFLSFNVNPHIHLTSPIHNNQMNTRQHACAGFPTSVACHPLVACNDIICCCIWPTMAHTPLCIFNGDDSAFFVFFFCSWWPWTLTLTFEFGRDFCTMYLTAKFDHPTLSRSKLSCGQTHWQTNRLTNKQTPLKNIHLASLCYAGG